MKDNINSNPLHLACKNGNIAFFDLLYDVSNLEIIEAMKSKNKLYETPLHEACRLGNLPLMNKIMATYFSQYNNYDLFFQSLIQGVNKSPFHVACRGGSKGLIKKFFDKLENVPNFGDLVNIKDKSGRTPLSYAAELNTIEIAEVLIQNKAAIIKDDYGRNPLHIAARRGRKAVAELLLQKFEDRDLLNDEDNYYETPLFHAVKYREKKLVEFLLER